MLKLTSELYATLVEAQELREIASLRNALNAVAEAVLLGTMVLKRGVLNVMELGAFQSSDAGIARDSGCNVKF